MRKSGSATPYISAGSGNSDPVRRGISGGPFPASEEGKAVSLAIGVRYFPEKNGLKGGGPQYETAHGAAQTKFRKG